jgi:hypothetical protein
VAFGDMDLVYTMVHAGNTSPRNFELCELEALRLFEWKEHACAV